MRAKAESGTYGLFNLVGRTDGDVRGTMVEGPSGLLTISPPHLRPIYRSRLHKLEWPNGAKAFLSRPRNPTACAARSVRRPGAMSWPAGSIAETYQNLRFGLRLGRNPRCLITSTPRPTRLIREIIAQKTTVQTQSSTYANSANLAPDYIDLIIADYVGTRLGRQEIYGEILEDVPGALWHHQVSMSCASRRLPTTSSRSWWPSIRR